MINKYESANIKLSKKWILSIGERKIRLTYLLEHLPA